MIIDQTIEGNTLRRRRETIPKHLKRGANEKAMDIITKRVLRILMDKPWDEVYFIHIFVDVFIKKPRRLGQTLRGYSIMLERR